MTKRTSKLPQKHKNSDAVISKIERIVDLVYASSFLKNQTPLSLMLIAPPAQSKTFFILGKKTKYSHISTDLSFMGVVKNLQKKEGKNALKHIIIPDFIKITGKKKSTTDNLLGLLNNFLEEGIFSIDLANREPIDFKGRTGGIITATTKASYEQNIRDWERMGLASRFIMVSYQYSVDTIEKIKQIINKEESKKKKAILIKCKVTEVTSSEKINSMFNSVAGTDIRTLIQMQNLAKCCAVIDGRDKVLIKDVNEVIGLCEIINTRFDLI